MREVTVAPELCTAANTVAGSDVLASLLKADAIPMSALRERYEPLLELVRVLIGVVPNCDKYLEIWPPAFRTYNILVPNFLNLPFGIFGIGGAPKEVVGLGMYVSSRIAECPYCSAHTCSFALRRGASPETVAQALVGGEGFTERELATIAVARSLAKVPSELSNEQKQKLEENFNSIETEWAVLGVALMGFLNKFMDAMSVELESSTVAETTETLGANWNSGKSGRDLNASVFGTRPPKADSIWTRLSVIRYAPAALRLDKKWLSDVPGAWPEVGDFLKKFSGHDFPVLSRLQNRRAIKAVAAVLRENLDSETTVMYLEKKALAGVVFATIVGNKSLADEIRIIGRHTGLSDAQLDSAEAFAVDSAKQWKGENQQDQAMMLLARAISPSPAAVTASVVDACRDSQLSSEAIVELVTWVSVLQMLHRLSSYFDAAR